MRKGALSVTGRWEGHFAYAGGMLRPNPFLAEIRDEAGHLSGTTVEPNTMAGGFSFYEGTIRGSRQGGRVEFTKLYAAARPHAQPIRYQGSLDPEGNIISGTWSIGVAVGSFEMRREASGEEEEAEERRVELPEQVHAT
jgi:hypothetical protein